MANQICGANSGSNAFEHPAAAKKTAVLLAPPKFREETSKKAVRLSAAAGRRMAFAGAACKCFLLRRSIFCRHSPACDIFATLIPAKPPHVPRCGIYRIYVVFFLFYL
jgi:hypothetical protein